MIYASTEDTDIIMYGMGTMWMMTTTPKDSKPFIKLGVGLFISILSLSIYF